jgi:hypothetical protein
MGVDELLLTSGPNPFMAGLGPAIHETAIY